jgi:oxaloacetate decarboxylase alpha subunit
MSRLKINETVLRDAQQSLIATRLKIDEIIPVLEKMDRVGNNAMEVWGGATFDSCLRFLDEDPWQRLRKIRAKVKKTKLQMLLRGQNILGYRHYPDDIVEKFIKKSIENGIDIIRVFDALNDVRNLETSIKSIKDENAHCQCAIAYTTSKVHTTDYYIKKIKEMESLGADSICIKDMAGILTPYNAYELIKNIKENTNLEINLHTHCTTGVASMTYMKAVEAGVDIIDTAISPFSMGTSQPPTESIAITFKDSIKDPKPNMKALEEVAEYFKPIKQKYLDKKILNTKVLEAEPKTLTYKVPGGMLSNLLSQLQMQNAQDKYEDVLKEVPKVREDLGYPPLVTPLSQMVGTQAVFNVLTKERYKLVPKEIKDYVKGFYGRSPAPINDDIKSKIIGNEKMTTIRPADLLKDGFEDMKHEIKDLANNEEDILSYALFPQVARDFLKKRRVSDLKDEVCYIEVYV